MIKAASILLRTRNEAKHLPATLEAIRAQQGEPAEIIVIDSGSTDLTLEIAASHATRIIQIDQQEWSYPYALNVGGEAASGEFLVCLSAHCLPISDMWLNRLLRHFDDPQVAGVWGPGYPPGRPLPPQLEPERQLPGTYGSHNRTWGLSNSNSALRRELWLEFPFDESLPAAEDKAWGREALSRGYHIVHDPQAGVWHATHSAKAAYSRNRAVAEGFALMFPDAPSRSSRILPRVVRAGVRRVQSNMRRPNARMLRADLGRIPILLAAMLGEKRARLRNQRSGGVSRPGADTNSRPTDQERQRPD